MISCLMVTLPTARRMPYVRRSIDDYCAQTFDDRELVILVDPAAGEDAAPLLTHIAALDRADIHVTTAPDRRPLGALRNLSLEYARGDVVCQWDDDDRSHPTRLERQYANIAGHDAVYLQEVMQYFPDDRTMHLMNWRATPAAGHPGTLMAKRTAAIRFPEQGAIAARGEDLALACALIDRGGVGYMRSEPWLFVYISHGANTWEDNHHRMLSRELSVSKAMLERREADLRAGLAPFGFDGHDLAMTGSNGIAFRL